MVEELCTSQAMSRIQLDLFFLCWVVFFLCVWHLFLMLTHACELCSRFMCCVRVRFYMCLSFLQKREDICHRHGGTHPVTSVSFFFLIFYGLASRALRCAVFIECYETPTTWDSLLSSAILFTQDRRGGCLRMHALRTHTQLLSWCCICHALFLHTLVVRVYHIGHDWSFWFVVCLEAQSYVCTCRDVCVHWRFTLLKHSSA